MSLEKNISIDEKNELKSDNDIARFCVFGTCTSRDIFNSEINPGYKNYFKIEESLIRSSFISLMSKPINYVNEDDVKVPGSDRVKNDFDKNFLNNIKNIQPEFLIIDISSDIKEGNLEIRDGEIVTFNTEDLHLTKFYKNLKYKKIIKIQENKDEFLELWKNSCDLFFKVMNKNCPNTIIILNPSKDVSKILKKNGAIKKSKKYKKIADEINPYRIILEEYICNNFDVEVLNFNENTLIDENHKWGPNTLHYEPSFYKDMTSQLNEIIKRNRIAKTEDTIKLNNEIRKLRKEQLIQKNKFNKLYIKNKKLHKRNKKLDEKINLILSSNSWKMTKPLRNINNYLKKIIKK